MQCAAHEIEARTAPPSMFHADRTHLETFGRCRRGCSPDGPAIGPFLLERASVSRRQFAGCRGRSRRESLKSCRRYQSGINARKTTAMSVMSETKIS